MGVGSAGVAVGTLEDAARGCIVPAAGGGESDRSGHGVWIDSVSMANPYPAPTAATRINSAMEMVTKRI